MLIAYHCVSTSIIVLSNLNRDKVITVCDFDLNWTKTKASDRLLSLITGCDQVIDKSKESLWETAKSYAPKGFQVVFDANGVNTLQESYNHLAPAGKLIIYGK